MQLSPIDLNYLHQESIGGVIAEALTVLYNTQPDKPIEYLAKWLLQYCKTSTMKSHFQDTLQQKEQNVKNFIQQQLEEKTLQEKQEAIRAQEEQKEKDYMTYITDHPYHQDLIVQEFPEYLLRKFNLSGVYICYFTFQKLEVDIDLVDDENAFVNQKAPKLLKYVGTSQNQNFLLHQFLTEQAILTYDVLKPVPVEEGKPTEPNKGCYIPDVVKETRIYFHRFPKLGCYFAIPMTFETCLFEDAFDAGLTNRIKFNSEVETQNQEKLAHETEHQELLNAAESEEQKLQLEADYQNYLASLHQIEEAEFLGIKQEYIVCGDTLGQDRKLSPEERNNLYEIIQSFGLSYQEKEKQLLSKDIDSQIQYQSSVPERLEESFLDRENQYVEQEGVVFEELKQTNERSYNYEIECLKFDFLKQQFTTPEFASTFLLLTQRRVIKFPNIFKALFYLQGYKKEEITEENKLNWKSVAQLIDQRFLAKLALINHKGPKEAPLQHATIFRLEKLIDVYDEEKVLQYNWALSYLQRFLTLYCKLRREDVAIRKEILLEKRQNLQKAKEDTQLLLEQKEQELQAARAAFQGEEGEEFPEESWLEQWEQEHPLPEIGPEPEDEIDDDLE